MKTGQNVFTYGLHSAVSQKLAAFITTAARTPNQAGYFLINHRDRNLNKISNDGDQ
jgi:hypothetical protein